MNRTLPMNPSHCPYVRQLPAADLAAGTTLKVVGLGGVGSIVARYLAVFLAALDRPLRPPLTTWILPRCSVAFANSSAHVR